MIVARLVGRGAAALGWLTRKDNAAEPLHREALANREKALGRDHPDYATGLDNLAGLPRATGRHDEAGPLYREALAVVEAALGPEHPRTVTVRKDIHDE